MKIRTSLAFIWIAIATDQAFARTKEEAYKAAATYIVTAHECSKLTGDKARLATAKAGSLRILIQAGYGANGGASAIAEISSRLSDAPTTMTTQLCTLILGSWEKASSDPSNP